MYSPQFMQVYWSYVRAASPELSANDWPTHSLVLVNPLARTPFGEELFHSPKEWLPRLRGVGSKKAQVRSSADGSAC
jgi:hypothetical protein